jgi:hypothetical protein
MTCDEIVFQEEALFFKVKNILSRPKPSAKKSHSGAKVEVVKEKDAVSVEEKVFHCGICDLIVTNQASLDQHLVGEEHLECVKKSGSGMIDFLMFRIV